MSAFASASRRAPRTGRASVRTALREERAALSVEAAIILPVLFSLYMAGYAFFDGYRREATLTKASYAVGDLLSRRTAEVSPAYLEGLQDLFEFVTGAPDATTMRLTQVRRVGDRLRVEGSYATDGGSPMTDARLQSVLDQIPPLADQELIVLLETTVSYARPLAIGLAARRAEALIVTRQRNGGQLAWSEAILPRR
jgi:hypothetical protein